MPSWSAKSRHPGFIPNLRWKTVLINYDISYRFIVMPFILIRQPSSIPSMLRALIRNRCCILSNAFTAAIEMVMWFWLPFLKIYFEDIAPLSLFAFSCFPWVICCCPRFCSSVHVFFCLYLLRFCFLLAQFDYDVTCCCFLCITGA